MVLGYLSDYFSVEEPTAEQTRDAYLFATGWWQGLNMFHCQVVVAGCITLYHLLSLPFLHRLPALVVLSLVVLVTLGHGFLTAQKVGMMARIITTAAIYQKVGPFAQTSCCARNSL